MIGVENLLPRRNKNIPKIQAESKEQYKIQHSFPCLGNEQS